jgi:hypothetical protein
MRSTFGGVRSTFDEERSTFNGSRATPIETTQILPVKKGSNRALLPSLLD